MEMIKDSIDGKRMVLFGSFGWGDSAYIEDLEKTVSINQGLWNNKRARLRVSPKVTFQLT